MKDKITLRRDIRKVQATASCSDLTSASQQICTHLVKAEQILKGASTIATYAAHGHEVNLSSLHQLLPDLRLLYPLCHSAGRLTFHHVQNPTTLTPGTHGILEPDPQQHSNFTLDHIDLFLCPGLAFTLDGIRLGQGGGFYDRILSRKNPTAQVIGTCMDWQILESIPCEAHDIQMDYLLTEKGLQKTT